MSKFTPAEYKAQAIEAVKAYNDLLLDEDVTVKALREASEKIEEAVNNHNAQSKADSLKECASADDPMLFAVTQLQYPRIAAKEVNEEDGGKHMEIIDRAGDIDVYRLHKRVEGGIGKESNWWALIENLNLQLTMKTAQELGIDPKTVSASYAMKELSKQQDLGKNPTSDKNLLANLQKIVTAMLGEGYVVTPEDVKFLVKCHARKDNRNKLKVACQNHNHFRQTIVDICHRIVIGGEYDVDYKKVKDKK